MTRSDDPFGDLPEWKERQRLQEAQEQAAGHPPGYQQPNPFGHAPTPQHHLPHAVDPGDPAGLQQAPDAASYYHHEPSSAAPSLHYNVASDGHSLGQDGYEPQLQSAAPFQPQSPDGQPSGPAPHSFATQGHAPPGYGNPPVEPHLDPRYSPNEGHYDPGGQYQVPGGGAQAHAGLGLQSGYDPNHFPAGQQGAGPHNESAYYDPAGADAGMQWQADQVGAAVPHPGQAGYDDEFEDDEDDYYDDDLDDDRQRYSWKMMAAVVVTGAVVTGGGVVLYDSFVGGGNGGGAPIIRADQAPAKTAPVNSGGRQFSNRDSKLLGRLDNANGTKTTTSLGDANATGNRVRSVPTVRIGRDGRLILPKAPETVTAPAQGEKQVAAVSGDRIAPGINVVESLGSDGAKGLGRGLPVAVPQPTAAPNVATTSTAALPTARAATPQVNVPPQRSQPTDSSVKALRQEPVVPAARSGGTTNRAILPKAGPPPVPSKSSLGTAWRSTSASVSAKTQAPTRTGTIRPTIAQPVQWQAKPSTQTASRAAPKLGAGTVASTQNRKYVAVLATAPTRMKALQSFAELQQKHPNALLNKVPDVQRADLSARGLGIMYRVVVGPAGSRSSANSVCSSLKSEGYTGCWVKNN